jgi:hypothetical protein
MTSKVGALTLPVPEATVPSPFVDPFIDGLLDFLAHCIRDAIGARLTELRTEIVDALPAENLHAFDPRGSWVRRPIPALYLWWSDKGRSKVRQHTLVRHIRERELSLLYVVAPVIYPDGAEVFQGVTAAADAALARASDRGWHPTYRFTEVEPLGTPLVRSLAPPGVLGWQYEGGQNGVLEPVPRRAKGAAATNHVEHCFPALMGTLRIQERVESDDFVDDAGAESEVTISDDGVPYFTRALTAS